MERRCPEFAKELEVSKGQDPSGETGTSAASQYMSLCKATRQTPAERGKNHSQEGAYMSLCKTSSEKQEGIDKKNYHQHHHHHHSESEYTSLHTRPTGTGIVDEGKNDSTQHYMSLNESTREREIFTSGAALRIQAGLK